MTLPEVTAPTDRVPAVSVLVTTYNRSALLRRALASILKQDFDDYEIVVVDDQSSDDTPGVMSEYDDPRIRYVRNTENMARKGGDRSIFQRFVNEQARGELFLWLCDDDYWLPADLLSRQVRIMRDHPSVVMIFGGMAQLYPTPVELPVPNEAYLSYEYVGEGRGITFARNVFPDGFLDSETFLDLFAEDPKNRNSVTGATMFRASAFKKADAFRHGQEVRWQSGYLMIAGTATMGDVWYMDEPSVVATVELNSASYRGSQLNHMLDCLRSIDAAFKTVIRDSQPDRRAQLMTIRAKMMHSTFQTYLANKISYRLGWFKSNLLEGIEKIFMPEISAGQFCRALRDYRVPSTLKNYSAVALSAIPGPILRRLQQALVPAFGLTPEWWKSWMTFDAERAARRFGSQNPAQDANA